MTPERAGNDAEPAREPVQRSRLTSVGVPGFWLALAVLVSYGFFTWWMIHEVHANGEQWDRLLYVYQGMEAIVFAAAGAVFGTSVQRSRAVAAEGEAERAKNALDSIQPDVMAGKAMEAAAAALARDGRPPVPPAKSPKVGASEILGTQDGSGVAEFLLRVSANVRSAAPPPQPEA